MSALFNGSGQSLSATLSNPPVEEQNRLITTWVRPVGESFGSENWIFYLCPEDRQIYQAVNSSSNRMWGAPGRYTSSGTPNPYNNAYTHDEDRWYLVGNFMEGHNGVSGSLLELMVDGDFVADWNVPEGTPSQREYTRLFIGANDVSSFGRWRGYIAELAIWIVDDRAHALAICDELLTKKPNAVSVATPHYYLPLESDVVPLIGAPAMTITGSVTLHGDVHPELAAGGSAPDAPTIGAVTSITHNSATINWTDNSDDETGFRVEYGLSTGGIVSSWSAAAGSPTAPDVESLLISGLNPATPYRARVAAAGGDGDSPWVETDEFVTHADPGSGDPPAPGAKGVIVSLGAAAANATSIRASWWDDEDAVGQPDFESGATINADALGNFTIDLDGVTNLEVGDYGYILTRWKGATPQQDISASGRWPIVELAPPVDPGGPLPDFAFIGSDVAGSDVAPATSVAIPAHQPGDLIVIMALLDEEAGPRPTAPAGWTILAGGDDGPAPFQLGYRFAESDSETSGEWSGTDYVAAFVWRGVSAVGAHGSDRQDENTFVRYSGLELEDSESIVAAISHVYFGNFPLETPPPGMVLRDVHTPATGKFACFDTDGLVSEWQEQTVQIGLDNNTGWTAVTLELKR